MLLPTTIAVAFIGSWLVVRARREPAMRLPATPMRGRRRVAFAARYVHQPRHCVVWLSVIKKPVELPNEYK